MIEIKCNDGKVDMSMNGKPIQIASEAGTMFIVIFENLAKIIGSEGAEDLYKSTLEYLNDQHIRVYVPKNAKIITVEDCVELKKKFEKYCETAEQHEFPLLLMVQMKLEHDVERIVNEGEVEDQKETRAMFRTVLSIIGENTSEYDEFVEENDEK